jgi:hypothetical protein
MGFTGSGATFTWPSPNCFAQLGIQRSQYSDRAELRFTINITVADREAWELARSTRPRLPPKPAPNTLYGNYIWQRRIGKLLPDGADKWWSVTAGTDWNPIADEVGLAVHQFVVPELRSRAGA